jgi:hypothetical protein
MPPDSLNIAEAFVLVALTFATMKIFTGPVGAAIADRFRGRRRESPPDRFLAGELDQLRTRLAELEERLDFAERLLARGAEADQMPGGVHR